MSMGSLRGVDTIGARWNHGCRSVISERMCDDMEGTASTLRARPVQCGPLLFVEQCAQVSGVGAMHSRTRNGRCCATSACAAQPHWALIWNDAIDAAMRRSHMTRAGTGTVPSVSLQRAITGCLNRLPACYRCPTSMRSSPCPNNWRH